MVSLVYPSVYPTKVDGKDWRDLLRIFGFRPRPPVKGRIGTKSLLSNQ
jgi:hypothetical protein